MLFEDFPTLAPDFVLPPELSLVEENIFSSVLRVSGPVNMWLHYDVSSPNLSFPLAHSSPAYKLNAGHGKRLLSNSRIKETRAIPAVGRRAPGLCAWSIELQH